MTEAYEEMAAGMLRRVNIQDDQATVIAALFRDVRTGINELSERFEIQERELAEIKSILLNGSTTWGDKRT